MKKKIKSDYTSIHLYKFFKEKYNSNISKTTYVNVLRDFFTAVVNIMIYEGKEFSMSYKLGSIRVRKSKIKIKLNKDGKLDKRYLIPDWGACRKLWKKLYPDKTWKEIVAIKDKPMVYHENKHTDGYKHEWHWDKSTCLVRNSSAYTFDMTRGNDRKLSKALKTEGYKLDYSIY